MIVPISSSQNNENNNNHQNTSNSNYPLTKSDHPNPNPNSLGGGGFQSPAHIPSLCYEPTSVLDLRRSASPVAAGDTGKPGKGNSVNLLNPDAQPQQPNDTLGEWDEHLHSLDWDTIMRDLGLHDDSAPPFKPNITPPATVHHGHLIDVPNFHHIINPHHGFSELVSHPQPFDQAQNHHHHHHSVPDNNNNSNLGLSELRCANNIPSLNLNYDVSFSDFQNHSNNNSSIGFDFIEDLIRVADCIDSDDSQHAQAILDRLNTRLRSGPATTKPVGRPLQRAALCFKDALLSLILSGSNRTNRLSSWSEIVQAIKAHKDFSVISPIPMFSHFTTNQALLETLHGPAVVHVIDFDIGLGGQYASLMRELAERHNSSSDSLIRLGPPILRVTAVVPEEYAVESRLVRENLIQFAQNLKIRFHIDFVLFRTFEVLSFKSIKLADGEKLAVIISAAALHRVSSGAGAGGFLADVRRVSPAVVVFVDGEGLGETAAAGPGTSSFRRSIVGGLESYSMVMESLDAAMANVELERKIEAFVLRPRVFAAVEAAAAAAGRKTMPFREAFHAAGMRPVQLSQFADFQAECLLTRTQVRGFHVATRQTELVLCWHERVMVATSVWKC